MKRKINPPSAALDKANAQVAARIEAASAIIKASEPAPGVSSYESALKNSDAVMLDSGDKALWVNLLMYPESRNYLLSLASFDGALRQRLEIVMRWLTDATPHDFYYAHQIQAAADRKYGSNYGQKGPDICLGCGKEVSNKEIPGGRISSSCQECSTVYKRTPDLILFERTIAQKMFISVQEYRWRVACAQFDKTYIFGKDK